MSCLQYGGFHGRPLFLDCTIQIITPFLDCTTQNLQEPGPSSHGGAGQSGRPKPAWRSQRAGEPRRGSALRGYGDFVRTKRNGGFKARAGFAKCWRLYPPEAAAPGGLANASRPHSQLCTRSPLPDPLIPAGPACTGQSPKTAQSAARGQLITTFYCHTYLPAL